MKPEKLLDALNDIDSDLIAGAHAPQTRSRPRFTLLIAAILATAALTATAFASETISGWFKQYFTNQSESPLSPGQIEFIEENEQVIEETQAINDWTVALKSSICDGKTAYVVFGITAPEGFILGDRVDSPDDSRIIPGNAGMKAEGTELFTASVPLCSIEQNYTWSLTYGFEEDGDGKDNTIDYVFQLNIEKSRK